MRKVICVLIVCALFCGCSGKKMNEMQWTFQSTNINQDITSISFADKNHGWAATEGGNLLSTSDGGVNWSVNKVCDNKLTTVYAIDKKTVWAAGTGGALFSLMEGFSSMKDRSLEDDVDFLEIAFWDKDNGIMVGNRLDRDSNVIGAVYRTSDGGASWGEVYVAVDSISTLAVRGEGLGWIGSTGHVLTSKDYGANWDDNLLGGEITVNAMIFDMYSYGWLVGDTGTYQTSTNGGWSWDNRGGQFPKRKLNGIALIDRFGGVIVGEKGLIMLTIDGGDAWSFNENLAKVDLYDIAVVKKNLWVCGADGTIILVH